MKRQRKQRYPKIGKAAMYTGPIYKGKGDALVWKIEEWGCRRYMKNTGEKIEEDN